MCVCIRFRDDCSFWQTIAYSGITTMRFDAVSNASFVICGNNSDCVCIQKKGLLTSITIRMKEIQQISLAKYYGLTGRNCVYSQAEYRVTVW